MVYSAAERCENSWPRRAISSWLRLCERHKSAKTEKRKKKEKKNLLEGAVCCSFDINKSLWDIIWDITGSFRMKVPKCSTTKGGERPTKGENEWNRMSFWRQECVIKKRKRSENHDLARGSEKAWKLPLMEILGLCPNWLVGYRRQGLICIQSGQRAGWTGWENTVDCTLARQLRRQARTTKVPRVMFNCMTRVRHLLSGQTGFLLPKRPEAALTQTSSKSLLWKGLNTGGSRDIRRR